MDFVQQVCSHSCGHACISMVTKVPIDILLEEAPTFGVGISEDIMLALFAKHGFICRPILYPHLVQYSGVYICTVPSLNVMAGTHYILMCVDNTGITTLYDPNEGRVEKKSYTNHLSVPVLVMHKVENVSNILGEYRGS